MDQEVRTKGYLQRCLRLSVKVLAVYQELINPNSA